MENKQTYLECIQKLKDELRFEELLNCDFSFREWTEAVRDKMYNTDYFWGSGACRCVIGHNDWDFVFKFTYDTEDNVDYCQNEYFLYKKALERGIERAFVACDYVGKFGAYDIYAMERCYCNEDGMSDDSYNLQFKKYCREFGLDPKAEESWEEFSDNCPEYEDQECMLELAEEHWGAKLVSEVEDFMNEYGVNDCHCGNWGWLGDNLVVVDYAGYGEGARMIRRKRLEECRV